MRSCQEIQLLNAVRQIKLQQIDEALNTLDSLGRSLDLATIRFNYYKNIAFMNAAETLHLQLMAASVALQANEQGFEMLAAFIRVFPDFTLGISGSTGTPVSTTSFGSYNIAGALEAYGRYQGIQASMTITAASMSATLGGYQCRADDWNLQAVSLPKKWNRSTNRLPPPRYGSP